jgi:hypothetical protein
MRCSIPLLYTTPPHSHSIVLAGLLVDVVDNAVPARNLVDDVTGDAVEGPLAARNSPFFVHQVSLETAQPSLPYLLVRPAESPAPPNAKVTRSNRVGRANPIKDLCKIDLKRPTTISSPTKRAFWRVIGGDFVSWSPRSRKLPTRRASSSRGRSRDASAPVRSPDERGDSERTLEERPTSKPLCAATATTLPLLRPPLPTPQQPNARGSFGRLRQRYRVGCRLPAKGSEPLANDVEGRCED